MERKYMYHVDVTRVIDGDTFDGNVDMGMDIKHHNQRFRLLGVNTPERKQEGFKQATSFTRESIEGLTVLIESMGKDAFGRWLCVVHVPDQEMTLNDALIEFGYAEVYKRG